MIISVNPRFASLPDPALLPPEPGSYLLVLWMGKDAALQGGPFPPVLLPAGVYIYCGSARGPGGIRARAGRHLRGGGARHWHIDRLLPRTKPMAVWARTGPSRLECAWARALAGEGRFSAPAPRFGASDCRCPAHLWHTCLGLEELATVFAGLPSSPAPAWQDETVAGVFQKESG